MRLWERELKRLIEAARRTKAMDFEWAAEACRWLLRGGVDEEARTEVARIVEEVVGEFKRKVEQWRVEGFDYLGDVWPLYERLLAAVELLAERPDKVAAQRLCDALMRIKVEVEEVAIKHLLGL